MAYHTTRTLCLISVSPSDDLSERRSSNSSLTSVTSRGSIMSPPEFNGAAAASTATNITTKMVNLKGRLSGAFSYWTGKEKTPVQEKPCKYTLHCQLIKVFCMSKFAKQ